MVRDYRVIDAHCHIYPPRIAAAAVRGTDRFYDLHSVYDGTTDDLLTRGAAAGFDHVIVQSVATTPHQVKTINEFIAAEVAGSDGRMTGLGTLHPDSRDMAGDIQHLRELGLRGVKLHPDIQEFKIDDYRCLKIYELCEREDLPILLHTGDSRFDYSNPNRLLPVMQIYSGLTVIGAHLGGWSVWDEAVEKLAGLPNLYVDTCSCFAFMDRQKIKDIILTYGTDRVLFGTDYPMWPMEDEVEALLSLRLSEEDNRKILAENAEKVFGL